MERKGKISLDFTFDENGEMLESTPILESSTKKMTLLKLHGHVTWNECSGEDYDSKDNIEDYVSYLQFEMKRKINLEEQIAKLHFIIIPILNYE